MIPKANPNDFIWVITNMDLKKKEERKKKKPGTTWLANEWDEKDDEHKILL